MNPRRAAQLAAFREGVIERTSRMGVWWIQAESGVASEATTEILRDLHTLKGEAGILGFAHASELIHTLEAAIGRKAEGIGDAVLQAFDVIAEIVQQAPDAPAPASLAALVAQLGGAPEASPAEAPPPPQPDAPAAADPAIAPRKAAALRIGASQLDRMRDAIGDLLSLRIRLGHLAEEIRGMRQEASIGNIDAKLKRAEAQLRNDALVLNSLVSGLEDTVRELRLVPVGSVLERYPRIIRDLGRDLGKPVRAVLEGESAVMDREVLEALDQALVHLVRNAVDHGIEDTAARIAAGKPEQGTIRIVAKVSASRLELTISDDGGGIDAAAVRRVAVERGLVDPRVEATDDRVLQWIMMPGFTTREKATHVSGRGVGLDAVHATVQSLGGTLHITSYRGRGTAFHLSVPINTAITSVLMFHVGEARYALPTGSIEDVVDVSLHAVEDSLSGPVILYRGENLPVISLADVVGRTSRWNQRRRFIIVRTGLGLIACADSGEHEHREAVMRPVGNLLSSQTIATSAILLEDGEVALVLNPARLGSKQRDVRTQQTTTTTVLVVDDSPIVRDLVSEALRSHGMLVIEAGDGVEALEKLEAHPEIALVVSDVEMPRMTGLELIRAIRARDGKRLPAVMVSTRGSDEDKRLAASIGADAYLVKSDLTHDSLWTLIERFVTA
jgi:chemotaxis protein histidine kinase CheA/ActR/RegA family two-component response regulator